jgi:hypothetical protein
VPRRALSYHIRIDRINIGAEMPKKQSSSKVSTLAGKVLSGSKKPTIAESKKLAASVLSQDEKKGQGPKKK